MKDNVEDATLPRLDMMRPLFKHVLVLAAVLVSFYILDGSLIGKLLSGVAVVVAVCLAIPNAWSNLLAWRFYSDRQSDARGIRDATATLLRLTSNPLRISNALLYWIGSLVIVAALVLQMNFLGVGLAYVLVAIGTSLLQSQIPAAIFLGATASSQSLFAEVTRACAPWKCGSLLAMRYDLTRFQQRRLASPDPAFDLQFASRSGGEEWSTLVRLLARHVRLVIVDGREYSKPLEHELRLLFAEHAWFKTLFIGDSKDSWVREVMTAFGAGAEFDAQVAGAALVVPFVRCMTRAPERMPTEARGIGTLLGDYRGSGLADRA